MKKENLLILFSKWPRKGFSKSRMAKVIGENNAKRFCFACLDDLIRKTRNIDGIDFVIVPNTIEESYLFTNRYGVPSISLEHLNILSNNVISEVFHKLFDYFLGKYKKVGLIPMDVPHINVEVIKNAFEKLESCGQVFGPEKNGGVYFMGLSKLPQPTFTDVRWSTENSFKDLIENSKSSTILEPSFDLNVFSDLINLNKVMLASCPHLTRFIKSLAQERIIMQREVISI